MRLDEGWQLTLSAPDAAAGPADLATFSDRIAARVPGTVAGALAAAGHYRAEDPLPLHDKDAWFVCQVDVANPGARALRLDGLATIAEVYWNGEQVLSSDSMFLAHEVCVEARASNELAICFRALGPHLYKKGPRARWRPQLAVSQGLRLIRTTLLGHMPGWCPDVHAVGPWRPISLMKPDGALVTVKRLDARLGADGAGLLSLVFSMDGSQDTAFLHCAGATATATLADDGDWRAELRIPEVAPWWPHTHGDPVLHDIEIEAGGLRFDLGRTGFRRIEVDKGGDGKGFALKINGVDVFCRGAVWTTPDIVNLPCDRESYRHLLDLARKAGMNMLRIGGTMTYEGPEFFALCDELGLMVWQDFQFANYDYPVKDEAFVALVEAEARQFLEATQACPSLAVICGGSEIYQQGAMLGLPEERWKGPLSETLLAGIAKNLRPDVPYVANSPCGGAQPFSPNEGIAHYYGVGAYLRPLEDARRANVRFAAECLAFSNVPQQRTLDAHLSVRPGHDPRWKARVPRDRGAGWDFEDVRDHYLTRLYGEDPAALRYGDPGRYLDLSRAVTGEVMEATFAEWRRAASSCGGALVWTFQDLLPGAGWGVVDATGEPKPAWYALKRAFRPVQIALTDEGTNGLAIHTINETADERNLILSIACLREGRTPVVSGRRELALAPRQSMEIAATDLFGAFFDTTYAYRFGPPSHDVTVARLSDPATGESVAEAFHFPLGFPHAQTALELGVGVEGNERDGWRMRLTADRFAQSVHVADENFRPDDDWFHLAPGTEKVILLTPRDDTVSGATPQGLVAALNGSGTQFY
ncbi:glycosyl hydrolase 2 galactose-binding domain-containing protein [Breoghania corrubedonensis]|nr:glycoside hydrolase family 2 protein [Breoghania corrubedonensis]